jgi:hypothetical protein
MAVRMTQLKRKKKIKKIRVPLRYLSLSSNNTSATKITPELQALKKRRLQEGNHAHASLSSDQKILGFQPEDSLRSQNNDFNNAIARHHQLRLDLEVSS